MFKFRQIRPRTIYPVEPILQVMQTHEITEEEVHDKIYLVDIVEIKNPQWQTIETIYDDKEYDKARGFSVPEPCIAEDAK